MTKGNVTTLGIDLAKDVFHLHGVDARGHTVLQRRITRRTLPELIVTLPVCLIGMESCGGSIYLDSGVFALQTRRAPDEPQIRQAVRQKSED